MKNNSEVAAAGGWYFSFDEGIGYNSCVGEGGAECPNLSWSFVEDAERGSVLQVEHGPGFAGLFFSGTETRDLSDYLGGVLVSTSKWWLRASIPLVHREADCIYPCNSGDKTIGTVGLNGWETVEYPVIDLVLGGLNLQRSIPVW